MALEAEVAEAEVIGEGVADVDVQEESDPLPETVAEDPQQKVVVAERL
jgi:hypothetical protein